jgi:hypothetical protein
MVTPNCYPTDVRRYGNRMNLYSSYPERRGTAYPIHPDTRTSIMSDRDDDVTPQRKRIAVAVSQDLSSTPYSYLVCVVCARLT